MIALVRVDNRLLHGQILEAWVPRLKVRRVVVADDEAAASPLAQAAMTLALPPDLPIRIGAVDETSWAELAALVALGDSGFAVEAKAIPSDPVVTLPEIRARFAAAT